VMEPHRKSRRFGYCICPYCLYPLGPSPSAGHCPECGKPYTHAALVPDWRSVRALMRSSPSMMFVSRLSEVVVAFVLLCIAVAAVYTSLR
jgi:hypothetical protein